jgi:hypothetical protein
LEHIFFNSLDSLTRPYWFWAPNSVFRLLEPIIAFLIPKINFFLAPRKIPYRWIYQTTIFILGPKFHFWALEAYFWPLKVYIFFIYTKFPIDWWVTWPISFLSLAVPSLGIQRTPNFFGLRTLSIKLQSILCF